MKKKFFTTVLASIVVAFTAIFGALFIPTPATETSVEDLPTASAANETSWGTVSDLTDFTISEGAEKASTNSITLTAIWWKLTFNIGNTNLGNFQAIAIEYSSTKGFDLHSPINTGADAEGDEVLYSGTLVIPVAEMGTGDYTYSKDFSKGTLTLNGAGVVGDTITFTNLRVTEDSNVVINEFDGAHNVRATSQEQYSTVNTNTIYEGAESNRLYLQSRWVDFNLSVPQLTASNYNDLTLSVKVRTTVASTIAFKGGEGSAVSTAANTWTTITLPFNAIGVGKDCAYSGEIRFNIDLLTVTSGYIYFDDMRLTLKDRVNLTVNASGGATVQTVGGVYAYGTTVLLYAGYNTTTHNWLGWYKGSTKVSDTTECTYTLTADTTLTAKAAIKTYTVSFNVNGGTGSFDTQTINHGSYASNPGTPTRTGYTFKRWSTTTTGSAFAFNSTAITKNYTLYAVWEINTYTVSFNVNGGTGSFAAQTVEYNSYASNPGSPTKTGYTFKRWSTTTTGSAFAFNSTAIKKDYTLYAVWEVNQYTLTFKANGGNWSGSTADVTITQDYKTDITAPANPTRTGYNFAGWDKTIPASIPAEDMTFTATWTIKKYTVSFDVNGGTGSFDAQTVEYNSYASNPGSPTRTGYTFKRWSTTTTGSAFTFNSTAIKKDYTLYAVWEVNQYVLTLSKVGKGTVTGAGTYDYGTVVTIKATPATGYSFSKWSDGKAASHTVTIGASDATYTATFTANVYNITLIAGSNDVSDAAGGKITRSSSTDTTITYDQTFDASFSYTAAANTGFTFVGWYEGRKADGGEKVSSSATWSGTYTIASDKTYYAEFEINVYTITLLQSTTDAPGENGVGGNATLTQTQVKHGYAVDLGSTTNKGYTFLGWFKDSSDTATSTDAAYSPAATADATYTAKWERTKISNDFYNVDGSVFATVESYASTTNNAYIAADTVLPANDPTAANHVFVGWIDPATSQLVTDSMSVSNDADRGFYPLYVQAYQNSVSTQGEIKLNFYLKFYTNDPANMDGAHATELVVLFESYDESGNVVDSFTQSSKDVSFKTVDDNGAYRFQTVQAPKDYRNRISMTLVSGANDEFSPINAAGNECWEDYSIATYLNKVYASGEAYVTSDALTAETMKNYASAMAVFCDSARQYFDGDVATITAEENANWSAAFNQAFVQEFNDAQTITYTDNSENGTHNVAAHTLALKDYGQRSWPTDFYLENYTNVFDMSSEVRMNFKLKNGGYVTGTQPDHIKFYWVTGEKGNWTIENEVRATRRQNNNGTTPYFYIAYDAIAAKDMTMERYLKIENTQTGEWVVATMSVLGYAHGAIKAGEKSGATADQLKLAAFCKTLYAYQQCTAAYHELNAN